MSTLRKKAAIIARFQVARLHKGHEHLVQYGRDRHEPRDTAIILGVHGGVPTKKDPLTFEMRKVMLRQRFRSRQYIIRSLDDHPFSHRLWSRNLDILLREIFGAEEVTLYGSDTGFIDVYTGDYPTCNVPMIEAPSGTDLRAGMKFPNTYAGRCAAIYTAQSRPDFMYATADLAIIDRAQRKVLTIRKKKHDGLVSFAGGHAMKIDQYGRSVGSREGGEEIKGIEIGPLTHIEDVSVADPRYRGTDDGVMTGFYWAEYLGGEPLPDDDADYVQWVDLQDLLDALVPWHRPLGQLLIDRWPT